MKCVILAGGLGTRLAEETEVRPKPMVEIGGQPILWHIMKHYAHHGVREFVVALGYKAEVIKRYFLDYYAVSSDLTIDLASGGVKQARRESDEWVVHLIDTGHDTNTGGRVGRLREYLRDETFMLTYGDGVADVDLGALLQHHRAEGKIATVTAVRPPARFGGLVLDDSGIVTKFTEKPQIGEGWINGGFFVFEPKLLDYIDGDQTSLEADALEALAEQRQLAAYRHPNFWQCMDTLRDKRQLEARWSAGTAPWKVWA
jgi:glucose-1-phosphate cytidylyltransferase